MEASDSSNGDLERRLWNSRPVPDPAFRGRVGRHISEIVSVRSRTTLMKAAAAGSTGAGLLLSVALGLIGAGPLAA